MSQVVLWGQAHPTWFGLMIGTGAFLGLNFAKLCLGIFHLERRIKALEDEQAKIRKKETAKCAT